LKYRIKSTLALIQAKRPNSHPTVIARAWFFGLEQAEGVGWSMLVTAIVGQWIYLSTKAG
jgi:hypothetical protein